MHNDMKGMTVGMFRFGTAFLVGVVALGLLCSCEKDRGTAADGRARVSFVVGTPSTRAAVTAHEDEVRSLDVLVFRADDGSLDVHERLTGNGLTGITAEVTAGVPMHWHVVANAPEDALDGFVSEERMLGSVTFFMDGTTSSLVMHAGGDVTVRAEGNQPVCAVLDRYTCKVTVESLSVKWIDSFTTPPVVSLERIVLVNAVGSTPWSAVPAAGDVWYNKMGVDSSLGAFEKDMLVKEYGSRSIGSSAPVDVASPLYCMPNPISNSWNSVNAPSWSPRNTRVAVELKVDGMSNWYPVDLPAMQCNRHYLLKGFTVSGPGSDSPDKPVSRDDVAFSVEILPWGENVLNPVFPTE